jgi:hypothetical protein
LRTKSELINWLGAEYKYTSYLEVTTANTGFQFSSINENIYSTIERIMYRLPPDYNDGMIISCGSSADDSCLCFKSVIDQGKKFDLVFIDPFHTYEASRRDLELALLVLDEKGTLVVHDCNPPDKQCTLPQSMNGAWLGETYLSFLDIVREKNKLSYCVVDMDFGCGVIRWKNAVAALENSENMMGTTCKKMNNISTRPSYYNWEYFEKHHAKLLNLKCVTEFKKLYQMKSA